MYDDLYKKMTDSMTGEHLSYEDAAEIAEQENDRREHLAEQRREAEKHND